jgi:2-C-methyl-D-erythritol 4-phosphate cytidylyltransferase
MPQFSVIFPAAGASSRFGANKLLANLGGQPVIVRTINAFLPREDVAEIIIATNQRAMIEEAIAQLAYPESILKSPKLRWCDGGETRAHTVKIATDEATSEWIAIHDAARPLTSQDLIDRVFACAEQKGASAPAMPVALTIKEAQGPLPTKILRTVPRARLWAMQTPQVMRRSALIDSYAACSLPLDQITDDVQLLELAGQAVTLVAGEERNLKITTPLDLDIALLHLSRDSADGL